MFTSDEINRLPLRQTSLTVTGSNWTTIRATGIPYQTIDGAWRFRLNISGSISVAVANIVLTVAGVTFKNVTNYSQAVAFSDTGSSTAIHVQLIVENTGNISLRASGNMTEAHISGDLELDSEPTI